jgi:hypothetical protein
MHDTVRNNFDFVKLVACGFEKHLIGVSHSSLPIALHAKIYEAVDNNLRTAHSPTGGSRLNKKEKKKHLIDDLVGSHSHNSLGYRRES